MRSMVLTHIKKPNEANQDNIGNDNELLITRLQEQIGMMMMQQEKQKIEVEKLTSANQSQVDELMEENARLKEQVESLAVMLTSSASAQEESVVASAQAQQFQDELQEKRNEADDLHRELQQMKQMMEGYKRRCEIYESKGTSTATSASTPDRRALMGGSMTMSRRSMLGSQKTVTDQPSMFTSFRMKFSSSTLTTTTNEDDSSEGSYESGSEYSEEE